jgi:hypothetical protein
MTGPITLLTLGGCLTVDPLRPLYEQGTRISAPPFGFFPQLHTFGEVFQIVRYLRQEHTVPQSYRPLCRFPDGFLPPKRPPEFDKVDAVLVELQSPVELVFRGHYINRNGIARRVLDHIVPLGRDAAKCGSRWYRIGLIGMNERVRAEAAEDLARFVTEDMPDPALMRAVIQETRSEKSDLAQGFRDLQALVDKPIGVVGFVFQYMPDGRAVSWPAGFYDEILAQSRTLNLPVYEPADLVRSYGVEAALEHDYRHYRNEFKPVIADSLLEFATSLVSGATGS